MPDPREDIVEPCRGVDCQLDARMAIRTTRSTRSDLRVTIYPDSRVAPKAALRYCKACGIDATRDLVRVLVEA